MSGSLTFAEVDRFMRRTGVSSTRFGRDVAGDPRLVFDLRRGRQVRDDLTARARAWMAEWEQRTR